MFSFALRRFAQLVPVLIIVSAIIFVLTNVMPGDPVVAILGEYATPQQQAIAREQYGLDRPIFFRYVDWLLASLQGDFGRTLRTREVVLSVLLERLPVTLELSILSLLVAVSIGLPAGVLAARFHGSIFDNLVNLLAVSAMAMPYFWLGLLLILAFSLGLAVLPPSGYVSFAVDPGRNLTLMILPSLTIGFHVAALIARQVRASFLVESSKDYVLTAQAKGLKDSTIAYRHVLRNALIPVITVVGLQLGNMLGGAIVTETVFSIPGLGRVIVDAVSTRDYPLIQGGIVLVVVLVVATNFLTDLVYALVDPRTKKSMLGA